MFDFCHQDAEDLLNKAMQEERSLFCNNPIDGTSDPLVNATTATMTTATLATTITQAVGRTVPPPPILLRRTDTQMTFRPAPWSPPGGQKVAWYRLFARPVKGSNVKVRLNDYNIPGTAEDVPAFNCELSVHGLTPDEKYMCAVAAYSADGQLIGGAVGDSTRPILASHPMSMLAAWAYLCQVRIPRKYHDEEEENHQEKHSIHYFLFRRPPIKPGLMKFQNTPVSYCGIILWRHHRLRKEKWFVLNRKTCDWRTISWTAQSSRSLRQCYCVSSSRAYSSAQTSLPSSNGSTVIRWATGDLWLVRKSVVFVNARRCCLELIWRDGWTRPVLDCSASSMRTDCWHRWCTTRCRPFQLCKFCNDAWLCWWKYQVKWVLLFLVLNGRKSKKKHMHAHNCLAHL